MNATEQVKHTPGPWTIEREADRLLIRNRVGYFGDLLVGGPNPDANAQNEANARLIAAAPDLLEAAKEMVLFYDEMIAAPEFPAEDTRWVQPLREAIAKAEARAD